MKDYLKDLYKSELRLRIDTFIEKNFIDIILSAKRGNNTYIVNVEENLLPFIDVITKEYSSIFDDCKVYNENDNIIIDWS